MFIQFINQTLASIVIGLSKTSSVYQLHLYHTCPFLFRAMAGTEGWVPLKGCDMQSFVRECMFVFTVYVNINWIVCCLGKDSWAISGQGTSINPENDVDRKLENYLV